MKKIIAVAISAVCMIFSAAAQENLISNGDMSDWKKRAALPADFKIDPRSGSDEYFCRSDEKHNGQNVLEATYVHKTSGSTRYFATPYMELEPGVYKLSFYVKGTGYIRTVVLAPENAAEPDKASMKSNNGCISKAPMGDGARTYSGWTLMTLTYNVCKAGVYDLNFAFNNRKAGNTMLVSGLTFEKQ